jgi:small subunit ribosomal protein S29
VYCLNLLQSILKVNHALLDKYKPSKDYSSLVPHFPKDATLADLVASAREAEFAWPVFKALWHELTAVSGGPPVLLTIDGLSHLMKISAYRDPAYKLVHAHELTLVRLLVDALAGKTPMANGGAVIAATSRSNAPRSPSMLLALDQSEAAAKGLPIPPAEAYNKAYDPRVYEAVRGVDVLRVSSLSKAEARTIMEYWAASGLLRATVDEATVTEKWVLAGNGNLGELERASLHYTRAM